MSGLDDLEDMPEYQCGAWRSSYVKIYSLGGQDRIAEISNYPRAYKDTDPHLYTEDVPFTVTKSDLFWPVDGELVYLDSKMKIFRVGEKATHWNGDDLPGLFPLWIESEELPFTPTLDKHVFPIDKLPGPIVDVTEIGVKAETKFIKIPEKILVNVRQKLSTGRITLERKPGDSGKQIIRIKYKRLV